MGTPMAIADIAARLGPDDFSLEKHRRIYLRMLDLNERGLQRIDYVSLAEELQNHKQLESVDGLAYLVSLDSGLPCLYDIDNYIARVKELSVRRQMIMTAKSVIDE